MPVAPGELLICKLWDTLDRLGTGLATPFQIRREGKARADVRRMERLMDAQTTQDIRLVQEGRCALSEGGRLSFIGHSGMGHTPSVANEQGPRRHEPFLFAPAVSSPLEVAELALHQQEAKAVERLLNLRATVSLAEEIVDSQGQNNPSAEPSGAVPPEQSAVDEDWLRRWRDGAETVSSEQMRRMWARLLTGEVLNPGSFSLRTVLFLQSIGPREATAIAKIYRHVLIGKFILGEFNVLSKHGIEFDELLHLEGLGIISGASGAISTEFSFLEKADGEYYSLVLYHNNMAMLATANNQCAVNVPSLPLSNLGKELYSLGTFDCDKDYLLAFAQDFKKVANRVVIGNVTQSGDKVRFVDEIEV